MRKWRNLNTRSVISQNVKYCSHLGVLKIKKKKRIAMHFLKTFPLCISCTSFSIETGTNGFSLQMGHQSKTKVRILSASIQVDESVSALVANGYLGDCG